VFVWMATEGTVTIRRCRSSDRRKRSLTYGPPGGELNPIVRSCLHLNKVETGRASATTLSQVVAARGPTNGPTAPAEHCRTEPRERLAHPGRPAQTYCGRLPPTPLVALSRWKHGFESRWGCAKVLVATLFERSIRLRTIERTNNANKQQVLGADIRWSGQLNCRHQFVPRALVSNPSRGRASTPSGA
jgi:hypothetical protein